MPCHISGKEQNVADNLAGDNDRQEEEACLLKCAQREGNSCSCSCKIQDIGMAYCRRGTLGNKDSRASIAQKERGNGEQ